jgi:hypothetical protein
MVRFASPTAVGDSVCRGVLRTLIALGINTAWTALSTVAALLEAIATHKCIALEMMIR